MFNKPVSILAHLKEVGLLLCRMHLSVALRAFPVYKLCIGIKGFTLSTVHSLIRTLVDITLIVKLLKDFLHLSLVVRISGTDKAVVRGVAKVPKAFNLCCHAVYKFFRCLSCFYCPCLYLLAMLICSCLKPYIIAFFTLKSGYCICKNNLVGIANMWFT